MSDYDTDILTWSERQADLLRRLAAGSAVNETPDWPNIIEEIEAVGRSELRACQSLLGQALRHMLKAEAWPLSRDAPGWRADAIDFRGQAAACFEPGMRQKINLAELYRRALLAMPDTIDGQPPLPLPPVCPVTLDDLLNDAPSP